MKMNKFFFAALAATTLLASCAKEDGINNESQTGTGEQTYAGISITLPASAGTRAEDPNAGINAEKAITTVGVYIVDNATARLDYKVLTVAADFNAPTTNGSTQQVYYTAKTAVPTVTGMKKVYVVANPPASLQSKLGASGATAMNAIAFGSPKTDFLTGTLTSMVMTGAYSGLLNMTEPVSATDAVDPTKLISITIGRNLSKAVLQKGEDYAVTPAGSTTTLTWSLSNEAKDAHFIKQTNSLYYTVPASAIAAGTGAGDAYWTNFTETAVDYIDVLPYGTGDNKTAAYVESKYMFENLPAAFHQGNTTAARIKGVFKPATVYSGVTAGVPTVDAAFAQGTTFMLSRIDGSYWTEAGAAAAAAANYNGHSTANFATDFATYTDGVGYYTIWVNDGLGNMGVNRNGYYLMQINEVRGPGQPTDPTTDPTIDPTEPIAEDTNLGVEITVLNWDFLKSIQDIQ